MLSLEDLEAHRAYLEGEAARVTQLRDVHQQGLKETTVKLMELDAQLGFLTNTLMAQARAAAPKE